MEVESKNLDQIIDESVTYRFVRSAGSLTLKPGVYSDRTIYEAVFKLCRYRPNITKKGKVLWKLDAVLHDSLIYSVVGTGNYYSGGRQETMTAIRYDLDSPEVQELVEVQRNSRFRSSYLKPIHEICFKRVHRLYDSNNYSIIDPQDSDNFWIPVRKDFVDMLPKGIQITGLEVGLHNKEFIESELSQHEYLRIMRGLKAKGWQTKR